MSVYLDTSVVLPLFLEDDHSPRARAWAETGPRAAISAWTMAEVSSALSMQVRLKRVTMVERTRIEAAFDLWARTGRLLEFQPERFADARGLLQKHARLRAPDALHLAIAKWNALELTTLDDVLTEAALAEGLRVTSL